MEKVEKCVNELVYCIDKINILISKIDKLNSIVRIGNQNFEKLGFEYKKRELIDIKPWEKFVDNFYKLLQEKYENNDEILKLKETVDSNFDSALNLLDERINKIRQCQNREIYIKAQQLIYIAKWENTQREISSLQYKDTIIDKIIGRSNVRKEQLKGKILESQIIKKEYNNINSMYSGQTVRETVCLLSCSKYKTGDLFKYMDSLINLYMLDEDTIPKNTNSEWRMAELIPSGLFNQIKYYKNLTKNLRNENELLLSKLNFLNTEDISDERQEDNENDVISKLISIKEKLSKLNIVKLAEN